jgi:prepilin-type N-terminal cleavage/methylation domain-containing protein
MRSQTQRGFTLFETVVAAAILSIMMLGVLSAVNGSFLADLAAGNTTGSQAIARRVMEETLAVAYEDLLSLDGRSVALSGFTARTSVLQSSVDTRLVEVVVDKAGAPGGRTRLLMLRSAR